MKKPIAKILRVDGRRPQAGVIRQAAEAVRAGGVIIFPTLGLYGLGADVFNPAAVARIFDLKGRDPSKPLLALIRERSDLNRLAAKIDARAAYLMDRFWPGRITFILPARAGLPAGLTSTDGKIGIRQAGHPVAAALITAVGVPITATSANLSGTGGCAEVAQIDATVLSAVDLILDAGVMSGTASTIVDISGSRPLVLRAGAVPAVKIAAAWQAFERLAPSKDIDSIG